MPVATMANPPEHDFAPSWLKIPNDNQLIAKPQIDQRSSAKFPPSADHSDPSQQRNRHYSTESFQSFPRHPLPTIHGYRSRDEKRFRPGPRYHSLEDPSRHSDLPGVFGPLQPNGFLPLPSSAGFFSSEHHQKRGSSLHRNLNHNESHGYYGRSDHGRGRYGGGVGGSGLRSGFGDKAGPDSKEPSPAENGGNSPKGEGVTNDGLESIKDKSALSSQDFPSLSGGGDEVKSESSKPAGAWDKPPGTTKINIGGRKIQLVQKTTPNDPPTSTGPPVTSKSATAPSPANGVSNVAASKMTPQPSMPSKGQKTSRIGVPLSSSSSVYKALVPTKSSTPVKTATPRKPMVKDVVMRPAPVISNKEKPAPPPGGGASSQAPPPPPPPKEASPRTTPAIDIPTPRMVTGKVKKTEKNDFLKELRRSGSTESQRSLTPPQTPRENGISYHHHYHRSSTKQYDSIHTTNYQDAFNAEEVEEIRHENSSNGQLDSIKCNGNLEVDDNLIVNNSHIEVTSIDQNHLNGQPMELSSSLEAEKRLLQQMGWHEHSDNEEGYAPITEDELNEFKQRSQQMKKNGLSRPQPVIRNFVPHQVISAITSMAIEDAELSSSSDTSDDEL